MTNTSNVRMGHSVGFTLVEMMVTASIILVLAGLVTQSASRAGRLAKRLGCISNLRQLAIASTSYSHDDRQGRFAGTMSDQDDDQRWSYGYISNPKTYLCPAARNLLESPSASGEPPPGLSDYAGARNGSGSSYEVFGFMNASGSGRTELETDGVSSITPGILKTQASVGTHVHEFNTFALQGVIAGPSATWLFVDGYQGFNFPNKDGNHGASGSNSQFCDGHVEYVPRGVWLNKYELSQDEGISWSGP